jgi:arylamine N-acetyltransferase
MASDFGLSPPDSKSEPCQQSHKLKQRIDKENPRSDKSLFKHWELANSATRRPEQVEPDSRPAAGISHTYSLSPFDKHLPMGRRSQPGGQVSRSMNRQSRRSRLDSLS